MTDVIVDLVGLAPIRRRLARLDPQQLLDLVGSEVESQTRRRIGEEKTDPDGNAWDEWSEEYAARRPSKGGILELDGHLLDSIAYDVEGAVVYVGSNLAYARRHNEGDEDAGIPERRYLGLSDENTRDVLALVERWVEKELF